MKANRVIAVWALIWLAGCVSTSVEKPRSSESAAVANMNLGAGYLRQGRFDLAIERLQRALKEDPRLADAHSTIAIAYDQLGDFDNAEEHYKRATQLEPDNSSAANNYAVFLCRRDRWRDAEPYFKRAVDNPKYSTPEAALTNAGKCAAGAKDTKKAEQYFRQALTRNPQYADALSSMADLAFQQGNYLQARAFVQRFLDAQKPTASILALCVDTEQKLGNRAASDRCLQRLRDGFPGSPEVARLQETQ
jgi:type IV pilus assembly protein PilF